MKKHEQFSTISQLPAELNRDEMTTFLHQLPHLPLPAPVPGLWTAWRHWFFIGVCSAGLLFTVSRLLPTEAASIANVEVEAKPETKKVTSLAVNDSREEVELIEKTVTAAPANLPVPPKGALSTPVLVSDADSLFPPSSSKEELFEPSKEETANRRMISPSVLPVSKGEGLAVPMDTGKVNGLFGDYTPDPNPNRFDGVPMKRLRRQLRRELLRDGLIETRTEQADLWLPDGAAFLNGEEMMPDLSLKYKKIARSFGIGTGPYRYIKTTDKGIALGDFREEGFFGRAWGVFKLEMPE